MFISELNPNSNSKCVCTVSPRCWLVALTYANLVVSMAQVDGAEDSCLTQPVEQVSNTRYGEYIEPGLAVQATIINTHA